MNDREKKKGLGISALAARHDDDDDKEYDIRDFSTLHQLLNCKHGEKPVTSLELRKLIINLCTEDKLVIGDISKTVGKSKSVIHSILRTF